MSGKKSEISPEKLKEFFKTLAKPGVAPGDADYSDWNQTEAEYRRAQAKWLEKVGRRKKTGKNKSQT